MRAMCEVDICTTSIHIRHKQKYATRKHVSVQMCLNDMKEGVSRRKGVPRADMSFGPLSTDEVKPGKDNGVILER